ncbi:hypothetical protein O3M35_005768 [Rhynocoris fuscipes]|uniref:cAMP-dependent protein kinase n=1 Tax=Rhynocoris fuscipes TaxID=488301 RepID=A0AAW1DRT2_9HEMI
MSKILKMNTQYHKSYSDKEEPQLGRNDSWPISDMTEYLKKSKDEFTSRMAGLVPRETVIKLSDLDFKKTLGQGAYGRVMLVSVRASGALYAAKLQEKKFIVKSKQINNVLNEKKLLESFTFPFTVNLEYFFQDNVYIYFVMPLMEGGDMYELLRKKGKFDEQLAKFYSAQIAKVI